MEEFNSTQESVIFCKMLEHVNCNYKKAINGLMEDISALTEEPGELRATPPQPATTTTAPAAPIPTSKAPEVSSVPSVLAPFSSVPQALTAAPGPSWAAVVRRSRKKAPQQLKPSATLANTPMQAKLMPTKK